MKRALPMGFLLFAASVSAFERVEISADQEKLLAVLTTHAVVADGFPLLKAPARVVLPPTQDVVVSARQPGLIRQILVSPGDRVSEGQILAQLASPEFLGLQREHLTAAREHAQADERLERDRVLVDAGAISRRRFRETTVEHDKRSAQEDETLQVLRLSGMPEEDIQALRKDARLGDALTVRAPFAGVVLESYVAVGRKVDPLAALFRVGNLEVLWLELYLPEAQASLIQEGDAVIGSGVQARIRTVNRRVDPANQSVLARAEVTRPDLDLRPGQVVEVDVRRATGDALFELPASALVQQDSGAFVFVRGARGFEIRPVEVMARRGSQTFVRGPIAQADEVVTQGAASLKAKWIGLGE